MAVNPIYIYSIFLTLFYSDFLLIFPCFMILNLAFNAILRPFNPHNGKEPNHLCNRTSNSIVIRCSSLLNASIYSTTKHTYSCWRTAEDCINGFLYSLFLFFYFRRTVACRTNQRDTHTHTHTHTVIHTISNLIILLLLFLTAGVS